MDASFPTMAPAPAALPSTEVGSYPSPGNPGSASVLRTLDAAIETPPDTFTALPFLSIDPIPLRSCDRDNASPRRKRAGVINNPSPSAPAPAPACDAPSRLPSYSSSSDSSPIGKTPGIPTRI